MSPTLFLILASIGVAACLGTVLARNLVHAALYLVAFFFVIACQFLLLEAEFLAAVQVLIYIGAVAILLMFGIMLTRNVQGDDSSRVPIGWSIPAGLAAVAFLVVLVVAIRGERGLGPRPPWSAIQARATVDSTAGSGADPRGRAIADMGRTLGDELMGRYALPFEVAGILLTAALVGSIVLARQNTDDEDDPGRRPRPSTRRSAPLVLKAPGLQTTSEPTSAAP